MSTPEILTLLLGAALGLKHATDADHIVAVSALVSEAGGGARGIRIGARWGLGHLLTVFVAGGALVISGYAPGPRAEWALELGVAGVLIWIGVAAIRRCFTGHYHFHVHRHGRRLHAHLHFHSRSEAAHEHDAHAFARPRAASGWKPLLLGMAHGLAGTAGLVLLVLGTIPSLPVRLLYLLSFGLGALAGMVAFSALLGWPLERASRRADWLRGLRLAAGTASALFGAVLTHRALTLPNWPF